MSPTELLDHLDAAGVTLTLDAGRIRLTGRRSATRSPEVAAAITAHRDLLVWHLRGRRTGHAVAFCSTCGAPTITAYVASDGKPRETWPTCRDTPRCPGRHKVRTADLERLAARRAPAPPPQPHGVKRPAGRRKDGKERRLLGPWPIYPTPATVGTERRNPT